jgi:hypothetical protein
MKNMLFCNITIGLMFLPSVSWATEIVVDGGESIQAAIDTAQPGDIITVNPGIYHEMLIIRTEGLTLQGADPFNPPILDGADQKWNPQWEHVGGVIFKTPYIWHRRKLTDKEITRYGGGTSEDRVPFQVWEDESMLRGTRNITDPDYYDKHTHTAIETGEYYAMGIGGYYRNLDELDPANENGLLPSISMKDGINMPGRFYYDDDVNELYVWGAHEEDPKHHDYKIPVMFKLLHIEAARTTVRNMTFTHGEGYAVKLDQAHGSVVEHCIFINNVYPFWCKASNSVVIRHNYVQNNGFWERYWYYDCKETLLWTQQLRIDFSKDVNIYGNVISNSYGNVYLHGNRIALHHNIISKGMSTNISVGQYDMEENADIRIYRNIVHHVDDNSIALSNSKFNAIWIYRNIFYSVRALTKEGASSAEFSRNKAYIYNNTVSFIYMITHHAYPYPVFGGTVYRNNIFYLKYRNTINEKYWAYYSKDPDLGWNYFPFTNGPDSDYNLLWKAGNKPDSYIAYFSYSDGTSRFYRLKEFSKFQQDTGLELNGLQTDPEFSNRSAFDDLRVSDIQYDTLSSRQYRDVLGEFEHLFSSEFDRLWSVFKLSDHSPAIDNGAPIPSDWPDHVTLENNKNDMGANDIVLDK